MLSWRLIAAAATLSVALDAAAVAAQTVYLTNAPPGSSVELVVNSSLAATAMVDADGRATLAPDPPPLEPTAELEAIIWLDLCGGTRRVVVADRSAVPPDPGACVRTQIEGFYQIRRVSSVVIDAGIQPPSLRIRQGEVPPAWLRGPEALVEAPSERLVPNGLVVFGGGGTATFSDFVGLACGTIEDCRGSERRGLASAGISYWLRSFLAIHASYGKFWPIGAEGTGEGFRFSSELDGGLVSLGAQGGIPFGRWRIFGNANAQYHRATLTVMQTIDERSVGETTLTLPGGAHSSQVRVGGFGAAFGGGVEVWLNRRFGVYGEVGRLWLAADDLADAPISVDDTVDTVVIGARVRVFGF